MDVAEWNGSEGRAVGMVLQLAWGCWRNPEHLRRYFQNKKVSRERQYAILKDTIGSLSVACIQARVNANHGDTDAETKADLQNLDRTLRNEIRRFQRMVQEVAWASAYAKAITDQTHLPLLVTQIYERVGYEVVRMPDGRLTYLEPSHRRYECEYELALALAQNEGAGALISLAAAEEE